jgi:hypothetical protein
MQPPIYPQHLTADAFAVRYKDRMSVRLYNVLYWGVGRFKTARQLYADDLLIEYRNAGRGTVVEFRKLYEEVRVMEIECPNCHHRFGLEEPL